MLIKVKNIVIFILILIVSIQAIEAKTKRSKKKAKLPVKWELVVDSTISKDVIYKKYHYGTSRQHHSIHVLEVKPGMNAALSVMPGGEIAGQLKSLHDIIRSSDSVYGFDALGGINANFWKAYNNFPIGPCVVNGEVLEFKAYKLWNSTLFDSASKPYIGFFDISPTISYSRGSTHSIKSVNRRSDSGSIVVYNRYYGDYLPSFDVEKIDDEFYNAITDTLFNDSTELEFDIEQMRGDFLQNKIAAHAEYSHYKTVLKYIDFPAINKDIRCIVVKTDTGSVEVPDDGCVISFGHNGHSFSFPLTGDTVVLKYSTNIYKNTVFYNAVSGTPRLVRDGNAQHEAYKEGSKGRRFIKKALPRTSIGTNQKGDKIYLVCVEPNNSGKSSVGVNLTQLSVIMKKVGCHNAMNLDGGGSSAMVIDGKNLLRENSAKSRRIATALLIFGKN
jgi:hypothetical protein